MATEGCWDEEMTLGKLALRYEGGYNLLDRRQMTDSARKQLLDRAGVPTSHQGNEFFGNLGAGTQVRVVQDCILGKPRAEKPILARWHNDTLRAVVSSYYTCVPHLLVLEALLQGPPLFEVRGFWPASFTAESKTMHLRLTTPTEHFFGGYEDDLGHTMIHVSNSEVGRGALVVDVGIFRLVCTNGLIARIGGVMLLRARHIYRDPMELIGLFSEAVNEAETVATEFTWKLAEAREQQVPIEHALAGLPSNRMRGLVRESLEGDSLFDLYNAVTNVAQTYTPEAQFQWERWGRQLLDRDWSEHQGGVDECPSCGRELD
jgi:hypothetical protein